MNGDIEATDENCEPPLADPPTGDQCDGSESLENPATCTATENVVTHELTFMQILGDCNDGYDLDSCDGNSCSLGSLAPGEGMNAVDNALAGLAPTLAGVGGNLGGVNQAFYDGVCSGVIALTLAVDANVEESCAIVTLSSEGTEVGTINMNLSNLNGETGDVCASGTLGTIPISIGPEGMAVSGSLGNAVLQVTVNQSAGFSNGRLGATVDQATAGAIADLLIEGGAAVVAQVLDINDDLSGDVATSCNALSMTLVVGGVVVEVAQ